MKYGKVDLELEETIVEIIGDKNIIQMEGDFNTLWIKKGTNNVVTKKPCSPSKDDKFCKCCGTKLEKEKNERR